MKLLVLDLAGTTVKDTGQVVDAFVNGLAEHGIHVTAEQVKAVRGASKREAVEQLVSDGPNRTQRSNAAYATFRAHLQRTYRTHGVEPIGRAEEIFRYFRDRGVRVALNTGFDREITSLLLDSLNWRHAVDAVVCGDDVKHGRPAPDLILRAMEVNGITNVADVANVGDTTLDLQAGHSAGVRWNIGVLSGAHGRDQMEHAPHTHLLLSVADLVTLFP
jgi:phosphonatase-like hydrolase